MLKKAMIGMVAVFLLAQAATALAAGPKIGVVKLMEVLQKSEPGKKAFAQLKSQNDKMAKNIEGKKAVLEKMGKELQKQRMVLSREARQDKEMELKRKARDYEDMVVEYQRRMKADQAKLTEPIFKVLQTVVKKYCEKNKFDLVFDRGPGGALIHVAPTMDITKQIIAELNKAWKTKGKK